MSRRRERRRVGRRAKKIRPYLNQMILKVPSSLDWDAFREDEDNSAVIEALDSLKFNIIGDMAGTTVSSGRKLLLAMAYANRGDVNSAIPSGWSIAGFEGRNIVQNRVLSHLLPDVDENGNETPITDCTGRLTTIAGHKWTY